jgi:hypothetical protein
MLEPVRQDGGVSQFPTPPKNAKHVYVVCRFDDGMDGRNAFALTTAHWTETEAEAKASELNEASGEGSDYFVSVARLKG